MLGMNPLTSKAYTSLLAPVAFHEKATVISTVVALQVSLPGMESANTVFLLLGIVSFFNVHVFET